MRNNRRKTLIFGNGLGMAHDPSYFTLKSAIKSRWELNGLFKEEQKALIRQCMPEGVDRPRGEEDLKVLQKAFNACDFLSGLENSNYNWLNENGRKFPSVIHDFLYLVGLYFHEYPEDLPDEFLDRLCNFIRRTGSHVATLNYDQLLYGPFADRHKGLFREKKIFDGFNGYLIDGFLSEGFHRRNLERRGQNLDRMGFYLHLHGSPMFVNRNKKIQKLTRKNIEDESGLLDLLGRPGESSEHLILTHFDYKEALIRASPILSYYWELLDTAISESKEIVLFGYSGRDEHLNRLLASHPNLCVKIVEWKGSEDLGECGYKPADRDSFWRNILGDRIERIALQNILEFTDWDTDVAETRPTL